MHNKIIPFNIPPMVGTEKKYIQYLLHKNKLYDDNFVILCQKWLEKRFYCMKILLTSSCTTSLEMAAILIDLNPGDEVIMSSYTFVSTANAFVLRGAIIVFVDIHPSNMNINENLIEQAITVKTRAIIPMHYAGIACEMDAIMKIAKKYNLWVIEDAAQGMMSSYKGKFLGTLGHIGCLSFHKTKNYSSGGEGGAILINDKKLIARADIIYNKGTNYSQFLNRKIEKYTWHDIGSNYLISNVQAACLWAQLQIAEKIHKKRLFLWNKYYNILMKNSFVVPKIKNTCQHNAHIFFIKMHDFDHSINFIKYMKLYNISITSHYAPLHSSNAGKKFSRFNGKDLYTTIESKRLVRLPIFYNLNVNDHKYIINTILKFY